MLNLHNEAASLCDRLEWGGAKRGGVTPKAWWGICCHPKDTSGTETIFPSMSGNGAHKAKAVTNPGEGAWPEPGCPPPNVWWGDTPTDAHVHSSFTCLTVDTPVCIYTIEMTSVGQFILWQVLELTGKKREDRIPSVHMPFGIVKLIISFSGTGKGGRYSQTKMFTFPALFPIADFYSPRCPETEAIYLRPIHKS